MRYLPAGAQVSAVAGSGDRRTVVAGLQDGRVQRWDLSGGERRTVLDLAGPPTRVTVSRDGRVVAATDGEQTGAVAQRPRAADVPRGWRRNLALGPDGDPVGARRVSPTQVR